MRNHRTQPQRLARILWLHITLSGRLDAAAVEQWCRRLQDHLSVHGLGAALSPKRIAVLSVGRATAPLDRSLVVLMAQAEVVFVHIERRASSRPTRLRRPPPACRLSALATRPVRHEDQRGRPSSRAGPG